MRPRSKARSTRSRTRRSRAEDAPAERRWTIHGDGKATIWRGGTKAADIAFSVIPAGAPTISLTGEPEANLSGSLTLAYRIEDRYGVTGARADFRAAARSGEARAAQPRRSRRKPASRRRRPPTARARPTRRSTSPNIRGPARKVTMTLSATSVSGKTGQSAPVEVTLPQRPFHNPLARALVEERRDLILDPDHAPERASTPRSPASRSRRNCSTPRPTSTSASGRPATALDGARSDADLLDVAATPVDDGAPDRGGRLHQGAARPARGRGRVARCAEARRERRGNPQADAEPARGGQPLRRRNGEEGRDATATSRRRSRTSRPRASTS